MTKLSREHYSADAVVVWCFDNRYWPAFSDFIQERQLVHFDPVIVAGGAKTLGAPANESDREFALRQIEISAKLHHTTRVFLMTHEDCGAFGGSLAFGNNKEGEFEKHVEVLQAARKEVLTKFPNLEVKAYFFHFDGSIEVT